MHFSMFIVDENYFAKGKLKKGKKNSSDLTICAHHRRRRRGSPRHPLT